MALFPLGAETGVIKTFDITVFMDNATPASYFLKKTPQKPYRYKVYINYCSFYLIIWKTPFE